MVKNNLEAYLFDKIMDSLGDHGFPTNESDCFTIEKLIEVLKQECPQGFAELAQWAIADVDFRKGN